MGKPLRVLFINDSEEDSLLIVRELESSGYNTTYQRVETPEAMNNALKEQVWDTIITDYPLPEFDALHALQIIHQHKLDLPFIVISSQEGEEVAVEIMREGAHDFLTRQNLQRLAAVVERELQEAQMRSENRFVHEELLIAEQSFSNSLDNSPLGICIISEGGEILYANQAILDIYGYDSVEEMENTPLEDRFTAESYAEYSEREQNRKMGKPAPAHYEVSVVRKDGEIRHMLVSSKIVIWRGEVQYQVLYQDITERKHLEDLYITIARSSPIGVYIAQDKKFCFINPQFLDYTGYTEDELIGTNPVELVQTEDRVRIREQAIQMLKGKRSAPYEFRIINKNGEAKWGMETITSIHYQGSRAILGSFMDITERKKMDEQLIVTNHLASIGELASGIAHEINNPLTSIIGFSDLLLSGDVPDEIKPDLELVNNEAKRASQVVKNILTFARGQPESNQKVSINDVIETVLDLRAYEHRVNNIQVNTQLEKNIPEIMADGFQLQQVFLNLIINAEYFMGEAHGEGKLSITTLHTDNIVRVTIADDGPGISPENITHLFNPFFTTKEVGKGTGLGLSISYAIVNQHGGIIYAVNNQDGGASFIVELPVALETVE